MSVLNGNLRAFNSYSEASNLHNAYFVGHACIVFRSYPKGGIATDINLFLFHFLIYHNRTTLSLLAYPRIRKN